MSTIDLNNPPPNHTDGVAIEGQETTAERRVRLFKDLALFVAALGFVILIVALCHDTLISPHASPEEQKWAMSVLSGATGGIVGYLIRR